MNKHESFVILTCRIYQRELEQILHDARWSDVELRFFPEVCHQPNRQHRLAESITRSSARSKNQVVLAGNCLHQLAGRPPANESQARFHTDDQCLYLLAGHAMVNYWLAQGCFLITPGWVAQWESVLAQWGFDQPTARLMFHESTTRLVLLDTGVYPEAAERFRSVTEYLDMPGEIVPVGLDLLTEKVTRLVLDRRHQQALQREAERQATAERIASDYAMAFDLMTSLSHTTSEEEVPVRLLEIFTILFSPRQVHFAGIQRSGAVYFAGEPALEGAEAEELQHWLQQGREPYAWHSDGPGEGFNLRLTFQEHALGAIRVADLQFPQYKDQYLNLSLAIAPICSLALMHARNYQYLEDRTIELETSIREQEGISYAISHDLRAPLRAINGFANLLDQDYAAALDPGAHEFITRILSNNARMTRLIDDLLAFTRLSRMPLEKQPVEMEAVVQQVLAVMRQAFAGRQIQFTVFPLPACRGDPELVGQVYTNLVDNAVKFSRHRPVSQVEIGFLPADGAHNPLPPTFSETFSGAYYVRDNGCGFDMQYAGKVFGMFQRLERNEQYEGTGVGLAVVQRIITRHGGIVWAESKLDQGSTFYFALP